MQKVVNLFKIMKKLLIALILSVFLSISVLPAFADDDDKDKKRNKRDEQFTPEKITCIKTALEKRENALIAALETRFNSAKKVFQDRLAALKTAWSLTDKNARKEAIKKAVKTAKESFRDIRKKFRSDKKAVWEQFKKDKNACGVKNTLDAEAREDDDD